MKNVRVILIVLLFTVSVLVWYFWPVVQREQIDPISIKQEPMQEKSVSEKVAEFEKKATPAEKKIVEKALEKIVQASPKLSKISKVQQAQNRVIEFYGQVLDQDNKPVSGVRIHYTIATYEGVISTGPSVKNFDVSTDVNGKFVISGVGEGINIMERSKPGYEFEKRYQYYYMNRQQIGHKLRSRGTLDEPVIFHAWKMMEAEPLYHGEGLVFFEGDGRSNTLDLTKGGLAIKKEGGSAGDIVIKFERPLNAKRTDKFEWSFSIESIGGGVIESDDSFMNLAPQDGYQHSWQVMYVPNDPSYQQEPEKKFYVMSNGGAHYARLEMRLIPHYRTHSAIDIKFWMNPNGSRNLQYDPSKRIPLK